MSGLATAADAPGKPRRMRSSSVVSTARASAAVVHPPLPAPAAAAAEKANMHDD